MKHPASLLLLFLFSLPLCSYEKVVDYTFRVSFTPESHRVTGEETILWKNTSDAPVGELLFHLYMNAFRNDDSTFFRESSGGVKTTPLFVTPDDPGWVDVGGVTIDGEPEAKRAFVQPDDGNKKDRTVLSLTLKRPVPPGATAKIVVHFTTKLPRFVVRSRAGYAKDFFFFGQWFPKLGVLEKGGRWNCHQYHNDSEFYADYGDFTLELTLPQEYTLASTGVLQSSRISGKRKTLLVRGERVHDFAWAAYPRFRIFRKRVRLPSLGVDTEVLLYAYNNERWAREKYMDALSWGLEFSARRFGPYPYKTFTVVDPPPEASGCAGMEYPTLITGGRVPSFLGPLTGRVVEMVAFHEFMHQYFYGMIGSNEFEQAWMDEGFTQFCEIVGMDERYGPGSLFRAGPLFLGDRDSAVLSMNSESLLDPIDTPSWRFSNGGSYAFNSYQRMGLVLFTLKNLAGEEPFWKAMRGYYQRYRFSHPRGRDFIAHMGESLGAWAASFLTGAVQENGWVDYRVDRVYSAPRRPSSGLFESGFSPGKAPAKKGKKSSGTLYDSFISLYRFGTLELPVNVTALFADGSRRFFLWDGSGKGKRFSFASSSPLARVIVDPEGKILLDRDRRNNFFFLEPPPSKISTFWAASLAGLFTALLNVLPL